MIKVYFTASTSFNGQLREIYKKIIRLLKKEKIQLISGDQVVSQDLLKKDTRLSKNQIFDRQKKLIHKADVLVAEVSKPSLGVGTEITYALDLKKITLALVHKDYAKKLSPMLAGNNSEYLYIDYYDKNNLKFVLSNFLKHIRNIKKRKGKLIVIEGTDGSGKATQTKLLQKYLEKKEVKTRIYDFPQYYHSFHGKVIGDFLKGKFGSLDTISPYLISLAYALDRASVRDEMEEFLKSGGIIISNRYTPSTLAFQGSRFASDQEKEKFTRWLFELEYKIHKIPKEDIVILLHLRPEKAAELIEKKGKRHYLKKKKKDLTESSMQLQKKAEKAYLRLAKNFRHWHIVECEQDNNLLTPNQIHLQIVNLIENKLKDLLK